MIVFSILSSFSFSREGTTAYLYPVFFLCLPHSKVLFANGLSSVCLSSFLSLQRLFLLSFAIVIFSSIASARVTSSWTLVFLSFVPNPPIENTFEFKAKVNKVLRATGLQKEDAHRP